MTVFITDARFRHVSEEQLEDEALDLIRVELVG
jgi:hypothetical protein